jgi:hypothetical protein
MTSVCAHCNDAGAGNRPSFFVVDLQLLDKLVVLFGALNGSFSWLAGCHGPMRAWAQGSGGVDGGAPTG